MTMTDDNVYKLEKTIALKQLKSNKHRLWVMDFSLEKNFISYENYRVLYCPTVVGQLSNSGWPSVQQ